MANNVVTDAGVGRALLSTRIRLSLQAFSTCFWLGAVPAFLLPMCLWLSSLTFQQVDIVKSVIVGKFVDPATPRRWHIRDDKGSPSILTVIKSDGTEVQLLTPHQMEYVLRPVAGAARHFSAYLYFSFFAAMLGHLSIWWSLVQLGKRARKSERIDGALDLVDAKKLSRMISMESPGPYKFANVRLPKHSPMEGILALGMPGSGKSLLIHDLMGQSFANGRKTVIYDHSGEYFSAYYRPGKDFFFNPALLGSVPWSMFEEMTYVYDANTLSHAFLPPKAGVVHGQNAFFEDAARALFSVVVGRLRQLGARHTRLISNAILEMPDDEMDYLIRNSVASSAVGGDSKGQRQGVVSSIAIYLDGISAVQDGNWTLKDFFNSDDDARLFILNTSDTKAMFAPLYRLMLTVAFGIIAAKAEIVFEDRYWFYLDEAYQLGDIKLDEHQATLRKFGVCMVNGIQSDDQYVASIGESRAKTLMNCFSTTAMLRSQEPGMQNRMALRIGRQERRVVGQTQQMAITEWRDGAGINQNEGEKWTVPPAAFGYLKPATGYLKIDAFPVAKVNYRSWIPAWYRPFARGRLFRKRNNLPPRDTKFIIQPGESDDPIRTLKEEFEVEKSSSKTAPDQILGYWEVIDTDTGETTNAPTTAQESREDFALFNGTNGIKRPPSQREIS